MITSKVLSDQSEELLHNWARWCRDMSEYMRLGYPNASAMFKQLKTPDWEPVPHADPVLNKDAERVEQAILMMQRNNPELAQYIRCRWVFRLNGRELAREFCTNKNIAFDTLAKAESTLEGMLWASAECA